MTLREFAAKNADILIRELEPEDLGPICHGKAIVYVSLSNKKGPRDDRTILWAGYAMTAGTANDDRQQVLIRTTTAGYMVADAVLLSSMGPDGHAVMYEAASLSKDDPRCGKSWKAWP